MAAVKTQPSGLTADVSTVALVRRTPTSALILLSERVEQLHLPDHLGAQVFIPRRLAESFHSRRDVLKAFFNGAIDEIRIQG